jgi:glycosyltransferase involved in cell wall biosynthesis
MFSANGGTKALLVIPYDYLSVSPILVNTINLLADLGYHLDVLVQRSSQPRPEIKLPYGVRLHEFSAVTKSRWPLQVQFTRWASSITKERDYSIAFGIDPQGLIAATFAMRKRGVPVVYVSLEFLMDDRLVWGRAMRVLERYSAKRATCTVIPGEDRAHYLQKHLSLRPEQCFILPNTRIGQARYYRGDFLRKRFNIPPGTKIFLQAGGIAPWNMSLELAEVAQTWPQDWALVLHGFAYDNSYLERIRALTAKGRVFLSTDLVSLEELDSVIGSANIGLVFYSKENENHQHISLASGKLADALRCGLPVITSPSPGIEKMLSDHKFGRSVDHPRDIALAASYIFKDYSTYTENSLACYKAKFDFNGSFEAFARRLQLMNAGKQNPVFPLSEKML